ncbi:HEPN domain-containing protein [Pseudomonas umsongensis]|uniref:HEPN domain-containing protein n=1 Tax=Pseudomonas umsongensis TaxID=198618 RepID=UPI00200AD2A9|nr:HEPN domain-containing protein [Pseudomonas umsongensis]MCK8655427.1 HEPN domain-containing protein [Pseudomonas umsongensis]
MESYKVEYLSVINSKEDFCKSVPSFNSFLQSYDNIKISAGKIKFEGAAFLYDVQFGDIVENAQRYFHVRFACDDGKDVDKFKAMLRAVRTLLTKASGRPPEVLWDDISSELSQRAYPIIHELENLMRKLITKFMFIKIGLAWTKDAVPKEVSESIRTKKETAGHNYLYEADFIQLSNFLFREYSTANSRKLVEKLGSAKKIEELDLSELQELVPRSNWERYFSPIVDCKIEYLQPRWERLYLLRCLIAHNNLMSDADYNEVCLLSQEVKDKLSQALDGLDKISVSSEQKEDVAENAAIEIDTGFGEFILNWNNALDMIFQLSVLANIDVGKYGNSKSSIPAKSCVKLLVELGVLSSTDGLLFSELMGVRNSIVHNSVFGATGIEAKNYIMALKHFQSILLRMIDKYSKD